MNKNVNYILNFLIIFNITSSAIAAVKNQRLQQTIPEISTTASLKLTKITNATPNTIKIIFLKDGIKHSNTLSANTSSTIEDSPSLFFIKDFFVDLEPNKRYIVAPKQTDEWNKLLQQKRDQLKERLKEGNYGVEIKVTGPNNLELVKVPLRQP